MFFFKKILIHYWPCTYLVGIQMQIFLCGYCYCQVAKHINIRCKVHLIKKCFKDIGQLIITIIIMKLCKQKSFHLDAHSCFRDYKKTTFTIIFVNFLFDVQVINLKFHSITICLFAKERKFVDRKTNVHK